MLGQLVATAEVQEDKEEEADEDEDEALGGETLFDTPANASDFAVAAKPPVARTAVIHVTPVSVPLLTRE